MQNDLDRETASLQELEAQKQDAQDRLEEMDQQKHKLEDMLSEVRIKCQEESQMVRIICTPATHGSGFVSVFQGLFLLVDLDSSESDSLPRVRPAEPRGGTESRKGRPGSSPAGGKSTGAEPGCW